MSSEQINDLKKWVGEVVRESTDGEFVGLNRVVDLVSKNFGVQAHEVAILVITADDRFLRFVVPEKLRAMGQIPLTSTNSLAARTAREKRPEVINHFAVVPHSSVFEAVPIIEEQARRSYPENHERADFAGEKNRGRDSEFRAKAEPPPTPGPISRIPSCENSRPWPTCSVPAFPCLLEPSREPDFGYPPHPLRNQLHVELVPKLFRRT